MTTRNNIQELGSILVVGAHPDDEIFMAAGIMAAAVQSGQRVACVTATRGEQGIQDERRWPVAELAGIRTQELTVSLGVLGVREHTWLKYRDGECDTAEVEEAAAALRPVIEAFRPDIVLTFGPDGLTGHPDHVAVSGWTAAAVAGTDMRVLWAVVTPEQYTQLLEADSRANIFFNTPKPPLVAAENLAVDLRLDRKLAELKRRAFEAVPSQMEKLLAARPFDHPGEALARECFVEAQRS
jgi:LmbE family N-acetylglucosaminyl deacetylase